MRKMNKEKNSIEMKPTVGFKLPWAGVTPAPTQKEKKDFVPGRIEPGENLYASGSPSRSGRD
jgi:hypothetical protein